MPDDSYRAEYAAYSARRAAEGLPKVSYRNYLRQWRRSEEGHAERGEPPIEKGGKGTKGGVTPSPPPPKRRQEGAEGGDAPPAVKAKGGDTPLENTGAQLARQQALENQERKASKVLEDAGYPEFPDYVPSCGAQHRHSQCAHDVIPSDTKRPGGGRSFLESCNPVDWLAATQRPGDPGYRAFTDRNGVYLHRPINRHLAENYSSLTRYGAKHIFVKPCVEVVYDIRGSLKAGKQTNQVIQAFDSVQIVAIHLRIATQQSLQASEYLMEWSGSLELPLHAARAAFETIGGETPLRITKSGDAPSRSSGSVSNEPSIPPSATASSRGIAAIVEEELPEIQEWLGKEGSLGSFREASKNPESPLAFAISKALAACLRHGHKPRIHVNEAGRAHLSDVLSWPRIAETSATSGDILEVVRSNRKQRYQMGLKADGSHYVRAAQGHSRTEVGEANLLEPVSEEQLPNTLLHGTSWNAYESIQQRGLLPEAGRSLQAAKEAAREAINGERDGNT
ncbi:TPT1, partial [Symbiodinium necroappetens]